MANCWVLRGRLYTQIIYASDLLSNTLPNRFDGYHDGQRFGWTGAMLRMPMHRLPLKLLAALFPHARAMGTVKHWGSTLNSAVQSENTCKKHILAHKLSTLASQQTLLSQK